MCHPRIVESIFYTRNNLQEFTRAMVQCLTSYLDYLYAIRISCKQEVVFVRLPFCSNKLSGNYSNEKVYEKDYEERHYTEVAFLEYKTGPLVRFHSFKRFSITLLWLVWMFEKRGRVK